MMFNVIDWNAATKAVEAIEDEGLKKVVTQLLPVAQASVQAVLDHALDRIDASLGNALSALTAERKEALDQIFGGLNDLLDRIKIDPRSKTQAKPEDVNSL